MAMTFDISEVQAAWLGTTAKRLAQGFATEGIGLPAAVAASAKDYYTDVRNVTPPANGGTVASVAFARGKATIDVDLYKAFRVTQKVTGFKLKAPLDWYLRQRNSKGRFGGHYKADISLPDFRKIQQELYARIGWMQSGWNSALAKFGSKIPSWVANKNGPGSLNIDRSRTRMIVTAQNNVRSIRAVDDMQRRINFVEKLHKKRLERLALRQADQALKETFE